MSTRLGVIGVGRIGSIHATHIATRISNATLVAIADLDTAAAGALAMDLGVTAPSKGAIDLIHHPEVDAVVICSSTDTHASLIIEAANAGKHVFCEKPVDHDLAAIDRALDAVEKAGVKFQVGFNRRFDPNFAQVRKHVTNGELGRLHMVRITSRDPAPPPLSYIRVSGGMFLDMTIHDFDMARFLVGCEPVRVYASGTVLVDPDIKKAGDIDTAVVVIEFEDGTLVTIENSRRAAYGYDQRIEVFGEKGMSWADNNTEQRTGLANDSGLHTPKPLHFFLERYTESFIREMQSFVDSIEKDLPPQVTGLDGRIPVVMAKAASQSLRERRSIAIAEISKR